MSRWTRARGGSDSSNEKSYGSFALDLAVGTTIYKAGAASIKAEGMLQLFDKFDNDEDASLKATALFANIIADYAVAEKVRPFISLGVGASQLKLKLSGDTADDFRQMGLDPSPSETSFSYRAALGVNIQASDALSIGLGYAYNNYGGIKESSSLGLLDFKAKLQTQGAFISAAYAF